jgi:hypothetical protein
MTFDFDNKNLRNQFDSIEWIENSGLGEEELFSEFNALMKRDGKESRAVLKAKLFALICEKSRLAIEDGRITLNGDKINFNGYDFSHCLFLYPKYAKKETYAFLNRANACSAKIAVVGKSGVDFEGNEVLLTAPHFDAFDLQILEKIGCEKSAIESGCVYTDGSFSLVSKGILTGEATEFDF